MEQDQNKPPQFEKEALDQPERIDALETPESVQEEVHIAPENSVPVGTESTSRHIFRSIRESLNIYLLIFGLLIVVTVVIFIVLYLNSQKPPKTPTAALQNLSQKDLNAIASGDANIGDPKYVLNVQSDAVFAGSALVRKDLNVAGNLQLGQALNVGNVTISGTGNFNTVQINTLSVATSAAIQGRLNVQDDATMARGLNVGGTLTAGQISTSNLTLGGNGNLNLNNHIRAAGPTPGRSQGGAVGGGGSTSLSGSDIAGTLTVNTGSSPSAGCFATINFVQRFSGTPRVIITPVGVTAASVNYYVDRNANGFSICAANGAPAGRSFSFDYFVVG